MSASVLNPTKRADMSADMSADTFGSKHADLADMSGNTLLRIGIFFDKVQAIYTKHIIVYIAWKNNFQKKFS